MSGARERRQQVGEAWTTWLVTRGQWRLVAACRSADPDLFFPISDSGPALEQAVEAKAICATCRVRRECLAFALRTEQVHGIWGGTTAHERTAVRRRTVSERPVTESRAEHSSSAGHEQSARFRVPGTVPGRRVAETVRHDREIHRPKCDLRSAAVSRADDSLR